MAHRLRCKRYTVQYCAWPSKALGHVGTTAIGSQTELHRTSMFATELLKTDLLSSKVQPTLDSEDVRGYVQDARVADPPRGCKGLDGRCLAWVCCLELPPRNSSNKFRHCSKNCPSLTF